MQLQMRENGKGEAGKTSDWFRVIPLLLGETVHSAIKESTGTDTE